MNPDPAWCHDCDLPVPTLRDFFAHANAGHVITNGRCPGVCQFTAVAS